MRTIIPMLFLGIAQVGCSSSYIVSSAPQDEYVSLSNFNTLAKERSARIVFQDGTSLYAQEVIAEQDSVNILDENTGRRVVMPALKIKKIVFRNRGLGLLEGAGIGILAGGATGLLVAVVTGPHPAEEGFAYIVGPILGGAAGLLIGPIYGVIKGHTDEYAIVGRVEKKIEPAPELSPGRQYKDSGFLGISRIGFLTEGYSPILSISGVGGAQVGDHFSLGVGVGWDNYRLDPMVPLFLDLKGYFLKGQVSPFVFVDGGYSLNLSSLPFSGLMLNPGAGVRVFINNASAFNVEVGYKLQEQGAHVRDSFAVRVAFSF